MESHDGRILVESAVGHGTTFEVRLPLSIAVEPVATTRDDQAGAAGLA